MRMRRKKHGSERLDACRGYILSPEEIDANDPAAALGMSGAPVWLEIGAGKGGFAVEMARRNPNVAYIAMERVSDCVVLGAERAKGTFGTESKNLKFIIESADNLTRLFGECKIERIFLNFSDPWTKKGYAKRRLTHSRYLAVYMNLLSDGGILRFKTDNDELFDFSLSEIEGMGLTPRIVTRDLHASEYNEGNVMTEYEKNFSEAGKSINMLELAKPEGFMPEIPDNLKKDRKSFVE